MSIQFAIDDSAFEYQIEGPSSVATVTPVVVYNTRQCITGPGGTKCIPAGTYQALSDPSVVAATQQSLNAKALSGLISSDNIQANIPQAGSNNIFTSSISGVGVVTPSPQVKIISGVIGKITLVTVTFRAMSYAVGAPDGYLELDSPAGQQVPLMAFGFQSSFISKSFTFADSASADLSSANPVVSGIYKPDSFPLLAAMNGHSPNGTWTFVWQNSHNGNAGSLLSWDVQITVDV